MTHKGENDHVFNQDITRAQFKSISRSITLQQLGHFEFVLQPPCGRSELYTEAPVVVKATKPRGLAWPSAEQEPPNARKALVGLLFFPHFSL
jgi:hypothetical protein